MTESQLDLQDRTENLDQPIVTSSPKAPIALVTFGTTFVTIFLAEIGDRTQLSTVFISAGSDQPWVVFIGAASALITTSLLGVLLGGWISTKFSSQALEKFTGMLLLLISLLLFWDVIL